MWKNVGENSDGGKGMEERKATDVLVPVLARLYEQFFLLDKNAVSGEVIQEGNCVRVSDFDKWCTENFEHRYEGDDATLFFQKISAEAIVQALTYEDEYVVEFSEKTEDDRIRRKRIKAFACLREEVVCVCVDDVTEAYTRTQSIERIAKECLDVAQQTNIEKERFWQQMSDDIRLPASQAAQMLDKALAMEGDESRTYVWKAKEALEKYNKICDAIFSVSGIERGEEFEWDRVIFTTDLSEDVRQLASLWTDGAECEVTKADMALKVHGFWADEPRLKQMLGGALAAMAGADRKASAIMDFDIREETDEDAEVFDLLFTVKGNKRSDAVMQDPRMFLAQKIADYMDGVLSFATQGEETELFLRIPVQRADKDQQKQAKLLSHVSDSVIAKDFAAFRALVVDDDAIGCEITACKLKQFGLQVETAADGQEALEKLFASPGRYYQILFSKMYLPRKSGLELTMELREMNRRDLNDMTIVALTANPFRDKRIVALEHGMDHHLILPFNDIELKEILIRELEDMGPEDAPEKFGFRVLK